MSQKNKKSPFEQGKGGTKTSRAAYFQPKYNTKPPHNATANQDPEYTPDYTTLAEVADLEATRWGMIRDLARLDAAIESLAAGGVADLIHEGAA